MKAKAKGDLFEKTFKFIREKWGKKGLERLVAGSEDFSPVKWYPFSDYCSLMLEMYEKLMEEDAEGFGKMGYDMIKDDSRWEPLFKDKHPIDIFTTDKRQEEQYVVGELETSADEEDKGGMITITVSMYIEDELCAELWSRSYLGRIQAILDFTDFDGSIELDIDPEGKNITSTYVIQWEG